MNDQNQTPENKMATLLGGAEIPCHFTNGPAAIVRVRQLPVRLMPRYLEALDDEPAFVELLCDKPAGWADTLTIESHEAILAEGERLNREAFFSWLVRRADRQERMAPGSTDERTKALISHWRTFARKSAFVAG